MNALLTELCSYLGMEPEHTALLHERDTSDVWRQFAIWLLVDEKYGVIRSTKSDSKQHEAIQHVAQLYSTHCKDIKTWQAAARSAKSAAKNAEKANPYYGVISADFCHTEQSALRATIGAAETAAEAAAYAASNNAKDIKALMAADLATYVARSAKAARYYSYAESCDASDKAKSAHCRRMANKLIELLQAAPLKETP